MKKKMPLKLVMPKKPKLTPEEARDAFGEEVLEVGRGLEMKVRELCDKYKVPRTCHALTDPSPETLPLDDMLEEFKAAAGKAMDWPE